MSGRQMLVRVLVGAVLVSGSWGELALAEGEGRRVPERRERNVRRGEGEGEEGRDRRGENEGRRERPPEGKPALPEGTRGFRGYLIGSLVSVGTKGCTLEVANARPTEGSKAKNPDGLIGKSLAIHYVAHVGRDGAFRPSEDIRNALLKLRPRGGLVTLKVRTDEGMLIADAAWPGARLSPERRDRPRREGEARRDRRGEGEREVEGRRERRREADREREGDRPRDGDREREGDRERRRDRDGDAEREPDRPRDRGGEHHERRDRDRDDGKGEGRDDDGDKAEF